MANLATPLNRHPAMPPPPLPTGPVQTQAPAPIGVPSVQRMAAAPPGQAAGMLLLPTELLQRLWMQPIEPKEARAQYQVALRCSFRAMRDATTPLIHALKPDIIINLHTDGARACSNAVQGALTGLLKFPAAATLTKLHWAQQVAHGDDGETETGTDVLTAVLSGFLFCASSRLAAVQELCLSMPCASLSCSDMCNVVSACPLLQRLTIEDASLSGSALEPLSRLPSLSCLALHDITRTHGAASYLRTLRSLSHLSSLAIHNGYAKRDGRLEFLDAVPHLQQLQYNSGLQDLDLRWHSLDDDKVSTHLHHLTALSHLTRLRFDSCLLSASCPVAAFPSLARLELQDATLDTDTIRLLASRSQLTELTAFELAPGADLRAIPCGWRRLGLAKCTAQQLQWLPLPPGLTLWAVHEEAIDWTLSASEPVDAVCAVLRGAADILARCWVPDDRHAEPAEPWLTLQWDDFPRKHACATVLHALSPLQKGRLVSLDLSGDHWHVDGELAEALIASLPRLPHLYIGGAEEAPAFPKFSAVLADVPYPKGLAVRLGKSWSQQAREAILGLATRRCDKGYALTIVNQGRAVSNAELSSLNEVVEAHAAKVGKLSCPVRFQHYLNT